MSSRIKGITVEIGGDVTGLDKALADVNKRINTTQSELRDVEKLLKLDPKNTVLLKQKQELLAKAVSDTEEKLQGLKTANEQAAESVKKYDDWKTAYEPIQTEITKTKERLAKLKEEQEEVFDIKGESSEEYKALQVEISKTRTELRDLKQQAKAVSEEFGNPISKKQYDALQREIIETENHLKNLKDGFKETGKEASNFGDYLKAGMIVEGAKGLISTFKDVAEESKELNMDLSRLEQNAIESGVGIDVAREAFKEFAAQSGETDSAIEGVSNLLQAGFTESNLQKAVEGLSGAAMRFPDTLKIESLADSLQETIATGKATGQFAELLDRLGVNAETFSEELATCSTEAEKQNLALSVLAEQGLNDSYEAWKENNEALYENNQTQLNLQEQVAELGETLLPVFTEITEIIAGIVEAFNNLDDGTQKFILGAVLLVGTLAPVLTTISSVSKGVGGLGGAIDIITNTVLPALKTGFSTVFGFIAANPVVLLIAAIVGLVTFIATKGDEIQEVLQNVDDFLQQIFLVDWTQVFGKELGEKLNDFMGKLKVFWDGTKQVLDGIIDFIRGVFTGDWERAWKGISNIFGTIFDGIKMIGKGAINGLIGILNSGIDAVNRMISGFNSIGIDIPEWLGGGSWHPNVSLISNVAYLAKGGVLNDGTSVVGEAGPEILTISGGRAIVQPLTGNAAAGQGLSELMSLLSMYLPFLAAGQQIVLDTGELVGATAPAYNEALGEIAEQEKYK